MGNENINENINEETEHQTDVQTEENTENDSSYYQSIIDQQNKAIADRDARIDKLIEQMQGLVNSHGNYKEPNAGENMHQLNQQQKEEYEPLSSLDFSM